MQILIDISEEEYKDIKKDVKKFRKRNMVVPSLYEVIENGKPLPKEHGDLIDVEVFLEKFEEYLMWRRGFSFADVDTIARIYTPAIIKKNK